MTVLVFQEYSPQYALLYYDTQWPLVYYDKTKVGISGDRK